VLGADKLVVIGCGISECKARGPDDLYIESDIHACSSASAPCKAGLECEATARQRLTASIKSGQAAYNRKTSIVDPRLVQNLREKWNHLKGRTCVNECLKIL
jgi:hypothetical protein